jgi:hypothetical protein
MTIPGTVNTWKRHTLGQQPSGIVHSWNPSPRDSFLSWKSPETTVLLTLFLPPNNGVLGNADGIVNTVRSRLDVGVATYGTYVDNGR